MGYERSWCYVYFGSADGAAQVVTCTFVRRLSLPYLSVTFTAAARNTL
jgi:hypothetical protein